MITALMTVGTGCEVQRHAPYDHCRILEPRLYGTWRLASQYKNRNGLVTPGRYLPTVKRHATSRSEVLVKRSNVIGRTVY